MKRAEREKLIDNVINTALDAQSEDDLKELLKKKINAAVIDKNPLLIS